MRPIVQSRWFLMTLLGGMGVIGVSVALLFWHSNRWSVSKPDQPTPEHSLASSPAPASVKSASTPVKPSSSPTPVKSVPASPAASPQRSPIASPTSSPSLTSQQQALNQANKKAFIANRPTVDAFIQIRVAIAEHVPALNLGVSAQAVILDQDGKKLQDLPAGSSYPVQPGTDSLQMGEFTLPKLVWITLPPQATFSLGDRSYRGQLMLVSDSGRLWAINQVNLGSYLYSVVGSEVSPSWPMEALKAQAVAARSYALTYHFKPVHALYDLGATEYYQVYSGIDREAPETRQAVNQTAGEFVSYRGGVVESLYAASDAIVAEAFQGHGMSQLGALELSRQGYSYAQILSNYYPKTYIGRVKLDME